MMYEYFPGAYVWSHGMLLALGSAPWGGAELGEVDRVGRRLREPIGDGGAWYDAWRETAARGEARAAQPRKERTR